MMKFRNDKGFTLIEILLVVAIMGVMLAVIVPRAWRANIDAKYGLVRQNCSELASFGHEWIEQQLLAQEEATSTATTDNYLLSLTGQETYGNSAAAIALQATSNWNKTGFGAPIDIIGRSIDGDDDIPPEACVEDIIAPEKIPRNPFNQASVFVSSNDPSPTEQNNVVVGAIACAVIEEVLGGFNVWHYYAFLFQGTDSTGINPPNDGTFHAGQDIKSVAGMRNGIFFARVRGLQ